MTNIPKNHWARQDKKVCPETLMIVELLREGVPFSEWSPLLRQVFAVAAYPNKLSDEKGRWTVEGRQALNMIRHLFQRGNFMTAPPAIREHLDSMTLEDKSSVALQAFNVRMELPLVTPPWIADSLF